MRVGAAGALSSAVTVSVTEVGADGPPLLLQVRLKVSGPTAAGVMVSLPLVASVPLQLPEAVQLVASTEDHDNFVELPTATDVLARDSVGAAGAVPEVTASLAELTADVPNVFEQVKV